MIEKEFIVKNKLGIHARPAALLVKNLGKFDSKVEILRDDLIVDGKSIMGIMMLAAENGAKLLFRVDGKDEVEVLKVVEELFEKGFYEE